MDGGALAFRAFNVRGFPTNVFINSKGEVAGIRPGGLTKDQVIEIMSDIK